MILATLLFAGALLATGEPEAQTDAADPQAAMHAYGEATATVLAALTYSQDSEQQLRSLYDPNVNSEGQVRAALAHAKVLGQAQQCDDADYTPVEQFPGMVSFKGTCRFANGTAQVLIAFGIPKTGNPVVLYAIELRKVEATAPAAAPAAKADPDASAAAPTSDAPVDTKPMDSTPPAEAPVPAEQG